ncbi:hypothetical protein [Mycobacteroides franklinii]|uniref:hypothetical protein n=1 Tax=Mycobacteroides franklinii TaxID=948102 RepID=UPI0013E8BE18|nr:hypothetical protein [Mycobacteroides franklinii]
MGIEVTRQQNYSIAYKSADGRTAAIAYRDPKTDRWFLQLDATPGLGVSLGEITASAVHRLVEHYGTLYDKANPAPPGPRELPSLDCEEARDGTVWVDSDKTTPLRYRFNGAWEYRWEHTNSRWRPLSVRGLLTSGSPYTEVVE